MSKKVSRLHGFDRVAESCGEWLLTRPTNPAGGAGKQWLSSAAPAIGWFCINLARQSRNQIVCIATVLVAGRHPQRRKSLLK
ncbi:MAG: hypothetical protein ACJ8C4_16255 [Gemmataceae bacterium]